MSSEPAIVAPVMRFIGVANIERSIRFYRDVLGFEIREREGAVEAVHGPARVRFDSSRGGAVLFFETGDVDAMHEAIRTRGGYPSPIEWVNRVKMRVFEVRDPDGHTLWFGQSYDAPDTPRPRHMMERIMPCLPADDVPAAVAYYRDVFGFEVNYQQDDLGVMDRDDVRLLLIARTKRHGIGSAYVYVKDADALYAELVAKGAGVQGEPVSQPWGLREFPVLDPEGNEITFGQPFE